MKKDTETNMSQALREPSLQKPLQTGASSKFDFDQIHPPGSLQGFPLLVFSYGQQPAHLSRLNPVSPSNGNSPPAQAGGGSALNSAKNLMVPAAKPVPSRTPYPSPNSGAAPVLGAASAKNTVAVLGTGTLGVISTPASKPVLNISSRKNSTSTSASPLINLSPANAVAASEVSPINPAGVLSGNGRLPLPPLSLPPPYLNTVQTMAAKAMQQDALSDRKEAREWQIIHQLPEQDEIILQGNTKITCPVPDNITITVMNGDLVLDQDFGSNVLLLVEQGGVYCKNVGVHSVIFAQEIECEDVGIYAELRSSQGSIRSLNIGESVKLTAKTDILVKAVESFAILTAQMGTVVASSIEEGSFVFAKEGKLTTADLTRMLRRL
jgi:hypothetical protein